jgi:hypothetical protein
MLTTVYFATIGSVLPSSCYIPSRGSRSLYSECSWRQKDRRRSVSEVSHGVATLFFALFGILRRDARRRDDRRWSANAVLYGVPTLVFAKYVIGFFVRTMGVATLFVGRTVSCSTASRWCLPFIRSSVSVKRRYSSRWSASVGQCCVVWTAPRLLSRRRVVSHRNAGVHVIRNPVLPSGRFESQPSVPVCKRRVVCRKFDCGL